VRVVHQLLCLVDVPSDVAAVCGHQVEELGLVTKGVGLPGRRVARRAARALPGAFSHGGLFR